MPTQPQDTAPTGFLREHYEITAADSGKRFVYTVTSRFAVILDRRLYPRPNLHVACVPPAVLGSISNIPSVAPPLYPVRYEGVQPGLCTIQDGSFHVTILITGSD